MEIVILTAFGVGGATVLGAAIGLIFRRTTGAFNDAAISVAAGVMLAAAMLGLILPSLEYGGKYGIFTTVVGIFLGAALVNMMDLVCLGSFWSKLMPDVGRAGDRARQVALFVLAIAIHNLPEGIAAGVGFGGDMSDGIFIATAIALQNIPEGMAVILAMLNVGGSPGRAFFVAALTGVVEIAGTFIGFFAVSLSRAVLPFILAIAGGNMLYVIAEEMIPGAHSENNSLSTYFVIGGFCLMLFFGTLL